MYKIFEKILEADFNVEQVSETLKSVNKKILIVEIYLYLNKIMTAESDQAAINLGYTNEYKPLEDLRSKIDDLLKKNHLDQANLELASDKINKMYNEYKALLEKSNVNSKSLEDDDINISNHSGSHKLLDPIDSATKGMVNSEDALVIFEAPESPSKDSDRTATKTIKPKKNLGGDNFQTSVKRQESEISVKSEITGLYSGAGLAPRVMNADPMIELINKIKSGTVKYTTKPSSMSETLHELYELQNKGEKDKLISRTFAARLDPKTGKPIENLHMHKVNLYAYMEQDKKDRLEKESKLNAVEQDKAHKDEFYKKHKSKKFDEDRNKNPQNQLLNQHSNVNRGKYFARERLYTFLAWAEA